MRKVISLTAEMCERQGLSDWRQQTYNINHVKRLMRRAQNKKRGRPKTDKQKEKKEAELVQAHQVYIKTAQVYLSKAGSTLENLEKSGLMTFRDTILKGNIENFMGHAMRQIDQINRRMILKEKIPHDEKVFSIFEPHTEWISKGKAGVPVELGLRVCILEDHYQFILNHKVMEKQTDEQVAIEMIRETKTFVGDLNSCSFDKGFHSPKNQEVLSEELNLNVLPRKGRLSKQAQAIELTDIFIKARRQHSAVESAINALEVHGLDVCPDQGIEGFKRYVALAVVARNLQLIGATLKQQEKKREERRRKKYFERNSAVKLAA